MLRSGRRHILEQGVVIERMVKITETQYEVEPSGRDAFVIKIVDNEVEEFFINAVIAHVCMRIIYKFLPDLYAGHMCSAGFKRGKAPPPVMAGKINNPSVMKKTLVRRNDCLVSEFQAPRPAPDRAGFKELRMLGEKVSHVRPRC